MEPIKPKVDNLSDDIKDYINNRIETVKLMAIEKGVSGASSVIYIVVVALLSFFFLIFISLTFAYALSGLIGQAYSGFLIVAGIYLLAVVVLFIKGREWFKDPVSNIFVRNIFKDPKK
jgi:hypothetical protein